LACTGAAPGAYAAEYVQNATIQVNATLQWAKENNNTDLVKEMTMVLGLLINIEGALVVLNDCNLINPLWNDLLWGVCSVGFSAFFAVFVCCVVFAVLAMSTSALILRVITRSGEPLLLEETVPLMSREGASHHHEVPSHHHEISNVPAHVEFVVTRVEHPYQQQQQ